MGSLEQAKKSDLAQILASLLIQETSFLKGFCGASWASKKNLWCPRAAKTPSKTEAKLGLENLIFEVQVGVHIEGVLATHARPNIDLVRLNLTPCCLHVSRRYDSMLGGQHRPMLEPTMNYLGANLAFRNRLFWKPNWSMFGCFSDDFRSMFGRCLFACFFLIPLSTFTSQRVPTKTPLMKTLPQRAHSGASTPTSSLVVDLETAMSSLPCEESQASTLANSMHARKRCGSAAK